MLILTYNGFCTISHVISPRGAQEMEAPYTRLHSSDTFIVVEDVAKLSIDEHDLRRRMS